MVITASIQKRGPLFKPNLKKIVTTGANDAMKKLMLIGQSEIQQGYHPSPARNRVGGVGTGQLRRSIRGRVFEKGMRGEIRPGRFSLGRDVPQAQYAEFGRRASGKVVKPKNGEFLRFKPRGEGKFVFARSVRPFRMPLIPNPQFGNLTKKWNRRNSEAARLIGSRVAKRLSK
jgi:hypothetical protein|tara:strand:+ start:4449 stop:4967 length:519 start_codon:yes stop_codon:yes gene_type:complete